MLPLTTTRPTFTVGKRSFTPQTHFYPSFLYCHRTPSILTSMNEATLIYPHQLFADHPALAPGRAVYLVEEPLFLTEFATHTQKLLLHRLSMQSYKEALETSGYEVIYLTITDLKNTEQVFEKIVIAGHTTLHIVDTTDFWLEQRINNQAEKYQCTLVRYESPLFILKKQEAVALYNSSNKHLATFYKKLRRRENILIEADGSPVGGQWSFDSDNRKKLPKHLPLPTDITCLDTTAVVAAREWLSTFQSERYGEANVWLPHTRSGALAFLTTFLEERLENFGAYEDALTTTHTRLFHASLSPLMNIGLLTPGEVITATLAFASTKNIPLSSLEGFIRQILGWREFVRAAYESDGVIMRTKNFWKHTRPLPQTFWTAETGLMPLDTSIKNALSFGYNHHIERLMVLGNFMLLCETHPDEVYRWFMAMYVDAYDWVMVPNVYGMSQFADAGLFATKPYLSGSNYIRKMSDYPSGDWEDVWTSLYWNFIEKHQDFFKRNHRLAMMPRLLEKMTDDKRNHYRKTAADYLSSVS